jgi:hypothetical protein
MWCKNSFLYEKAMQKAIKIAFCDVVQTKNVASTSLHYGYKSCKLTITQKMN